MKFVGRMIDGKLRFTEGESSTKAMSWIEIGTNLYHECVRPVIRPFCSHLVSCAGVSLCLSSDVI